MPFISRYLYSNCATLVVGCTLYSNNERTAVYANKQIAIISGGIKKVYSTMVSGEIVSITTCSYTSTSAYNIYAPFYSGTRNNCGNGGAGSTISVNDGGAYSFSGSTSPITSYVSQGDADSQAFAISQANFNAGIQNYINNNASCTWSYYSGSATYPATSYTRNNCGAGCDAGAVTYGEVPKSGYGATSTSSYQNAVDTANGYAYSAAQAESQSAGQANANTYGSCCCWVPASTAEKCDGCNYRGNREKNQCTGAFRNDTPTEYGSCTCNVGCAGTSYGSNYCSGFDGKNRTYYQTYNCNGSSTGASYEVNCGCNDGMTDRQPTGNTTCIGCSNVAIYYDYNRCSGTSGHYFVNGADVGTDPPSTGTCWTGTNYAAYKGVYCYGGTNYDVYEDTNHECSQQVRYELRDRYGNTVSDSNSLGGSPCQTSEYRSGTFTRNNCGGGYIAGSVSYSNTYYYTGIKNYAGAVEIADANFNNDGQNYANANGSCTAIPTCYTYNIISNNDSVYVDGFYTACGGYTDYFSYYSSSSYSYVGSVCAQASSVYVTANGFANSSGGC